MEQTKEKKSTKKQSRNTKDIVKEKYVDNYYSKSFLKKYFS